ncbi:MAG: hypothetical protein IPL52_01235 [Flavobacteriales bacterium]|nr:hypothetical protein [Flavobacteriales bacterium]
MMTPRTERERLEQVLIGQSELMFQVHLWLAEEEKHDDLIRALVLSSRKRVPVKARGLDPQRIFDRETIRELCVKYRLRFLEGALYKGELPSQAVQAIRTLERSVHEPVVSYMVMAPAARFKLCDSEVDPLLFVPLDNDRYYLVHKWGNDLSRARALLYWPVRSVAHLAASVFLLALLFTCLIPGHWLAKGDDAFVFGQRSLLLFWSVMVFGGFTVFGWFAFFGQFSAQAWNSRYFN